MFKILVVEDDRDLNRTVCTFLNQSGYESTGCLNAVDAYDTMYDTVFDLIVSDIMMPDVDGFEFVKSVRAVNENIPILFMTARDDFAAKQKGYRVGVDDYMVKPIDLDELFLRIGALLRRAKIASSRRLEVGNFVMDADEHTAYLDNKEIPLNLIRIRSSGTLVGAGGFGPPKRNATDLQSAPFGHSGTLPHIKFPLPGTCLPIMLSSTQYINVCRQKNGAGGRTRTPDLLITNQLLYQLSYTSVFIVFSSALII